MRILSPMWALPMCGAPFPQWEADGFVLSVWIEKYYDAFESNDGRLKTIVTSYKDKNGVIINKDNLGVRWNGYISDRSVKL